MGHTLEAWILLHVQDVLSLCVPNRLLGDLGQEGEAIQVLVFGGFHFSHGGWPCSGSSYGGGSTWAPSSVEDHEHLQPWPYNVWDLVDPG